MEKIDGGLSNVPGFKSSGIHCGIKKNGKSDLALIFSEVSAAVAGVFTMNKIKAAPVVLNMAKLKKGQGRAIIINSGNANACTGIQGIKDAEIIVETVSAKLNISQESTFIASTGIIGKPLPIEKILPNIPALVDNLSRNGGGEAAEAIMTTDTFLKEIAVREYIDGKPVTMAGIAKGAGMIHPDMATMLSFIITDINIKHHSLQKALKSSIEKSFNMITIDGDTSTNDTVLILANGRAGNKEIECGTPEFSKIQTMLDFVTQSLAKMIIQDGEGATKFVEIKVRGARHFKEAKKIAFAIANSCLVKTAFFGENPNWGRIMAAIGSTGIEIEEVKVAIFFDDLKIVKGGISLKQFETPILDILRKDSFTVTIDLGLGGEEAIVWTTDLSCEYVEINAHYDT